MSWIFDDFYGNNSRINDIANVEVAEFDSIALGVTSVKNI